MLVKSEEMARLVEIFMLIVVVVVFALGALVS